MEKPDQNHETEAVTEHGFSDSAARRRRVKKRGKGIKITLVSLLVLLALLVSVSAAILLPLYEAYLGSYEHVPIVSRTDDYTLPPKPPGFTGDYTEEGTDGEDLPPDSETSGEEEPPPPDTTEEYVGDPVEVPGIHLKQQIDPNVENILVIGTDSRSLTSMQGRTDVMMICSYNKATGKATLLSLLRDMLVPIEGVGWNRLNAAYSLGGVALCINTINDLFDLDIQKFVLINFEGTMDIVDSCGGVEIPLTQSEVDYLHYDGTNPVLVRSEGDTNYYLLDGKTALSHMRHRKGSSDFKRTERQRNVMMALFRQVVSTRDWTEIYSLVIDACKIVKTNMELGEIIELASTAVGHGANMAIESKRIPTRFANANFDIAKQQYVTSGGAAILDIDIEQQKEQLHKYLYGK